MSVPHMRKDSIADELQTARACNSVLKRINANLKKELMIIRRLIESSIQNNVFHINSDLKSQSSKEFLKPGFNDLASDLNQVILCWKFFCR